MISWWPPVGGFHMRTTSGATPGLPKHTGPLNDSRCNSSSAEAGFQKAYHQATSQLLPKEIHTITGEGPFFFVETSATANINLDMLQIYAIPQIQHLQHTVIFQLDAGTRMFEHFAGTGLPAGYPQGY
ncbi:hypothetical protein AVEN_217683-1 [Araneus ventricosus]|uniref:Uncharacterized protein n=1 Tax=Araneus ventricosus TaxID=182803 RepID=A0A4Y2UFF2_ARAVE|nr:hypothetical protein AVEN_217683-1 [Araneus ventricosus]